jgi:orotate phosphoribosyltransferase
MAYDLDTRPKQLLGLESGSIPIMTALSLTREFVYFNTMTLRKERKPYGVRSLVEGRVFQNAPCLVVDDLIASGSGCRRCIDTAIDCLGLEVLPFVLCIVNKGTSDKLVHRDKTYKILSLFKHSQFNLLKFDPNAYWEPKDFEWEPNETALPVD